MKEIIQTLQAITKSVSEPFWNKLDFWLSTGFSLIGFWLSYLAYQEAKKAKEAAENAAKTVKVLTVAMELTEIVQKLDRLDENIQYSACRDFLIENARKIRRLIAPFREDTGLSVSITNVEATLDQIRGALEGVRPYGNEIEGSSYAVYTAVEAPFSVLSGQLGELIGLFESRTIIIQ